jgi:hypothetical protein
MRALKRSLRLRIPRLEDHPPQLEPNAKRTHPSSNRPQNAANGSVARPPAAIAAPRSHTSFSGSAPNRVRLRANPHRTSGASFENTNVPAITRDQHTSQVTTQLGWSAQDR